MLSCACFGNSRRKKAEGFNTSPQEHTGNENHANLDHTDHDHVGHDHVDHDHADHDLADQDHVDQDYVDQDHVDQDHVDQDHVDQDHGDQDHPIQHKHNESLAGEGQDSGKSIVQELWKAAFRNLEDENGTLMKKFKELMKLELKDLDPAKSTHLNAEEDWNLMEAFVSSQVPHALDPAKGKVLNGLDQAFRILRGIIDLINEPIKLAPQAAVPWAGVNIAVTVISNPLLERKANLDGLQAAFDKLNWYREIAADLFQSEEAGHTILRQRDLLKIKMVDYFQKLLLYQIRSILLLHTNKVLVAIRGVAKFDNWEQQLKEIKEAETELDSRIEQYQNRREREEKEQRQKEETRNMCLNALEVPDPKYDKRRILQDKGGLVPSCCDWIREEQQLEQRSFLNWINDPEKSIFWITGKAGKGKTMLVCDLIQGLEETLHKGPLFYTFCEISKSQSADYNATTLRGLIYTIASQHPSLTHYIRAEWDKNHSLFKDVNARLKSYDILKAILVDDVMNGTIIFVDALDECGNDLDLLLDLITTISNIKWVVSSRSNTNLIDEKLSNSPQCQKVSLDELGDLVTTAVAIYIEKQVHDLKQIKKYTDDDSLNIRRYLMKHAEGTFLWVALACKELWDPDTDDDALEVLNSLPRGLDAMYERMMGKIQTAKKERTRLFEIILSVNLVVSRSITIDEFLLLVKSSKKLNLFKDARHLQQMTEKCGYFFTISHGDNALSSSGNFINFVHKSAKDYLLENRSEKVPLPGLNYDIFQRCLEQMSEHLRRDMLDLKHPGAIPTKEHPALKRLNRIEYACTCWAEHIDCNNHVDNTCKEYGNSIQDFLSNHFLCWIEALSLLGKLSAGAMALQKLKDFADNHKMQHLSELLRDAYVFFITFRLPIEQRPLQVYTSALLFTPTCSQLKTVFAEYAPNWVTIRSGLKKQWPSHLHAIEGLHGSIRKVAYSKDGRKLISASCSDVDIRDTTTSASLQKFHVPAHQNSEPRDFEISGDGTRVAWCWGNSHTLIKVLDTTVGIWIEMAGGHLDGRSLLFSQEGSRLASSSKECIKLWDAKRGVLFCELPLLCDWSPSFCFLGDGTQFASASDRTGEPIQIWCTESGHLEKQIALEDGTMVRTLTSFPNDQSRLLSVYDNEKAEIWDLLSEQSVFDFDNFVDGLQGVGISRDGETIVIITDSEEAYLWDLKKKTNFKLDGSYSTPLIFSNDSKLLAMQATWDDEIWVWDIDSRKIIRKFEGHDDIVRSMAFSPDSRFLASNTGDRGNPGEDYTKIWDINTVNLELTDVVEHEEKTNAISHVSFSKEGKWLAVVSEDSGIDLWDNSGTFICRVSDQEDVRCISFSWDSMKLAFGTVDGICGIANISPKPDTLDTSSRKLIPEGGSTVTSLSFSRDDMLLAAVVIDRIRFFNIETGKYCQTQHPKPNEDEYFGHYREDPHICAVNFYKNSLAVSIAENGNAQMWNTVTGECLKEFRAESPKNIYGMVSAAIDVRLYQDSLQLISTSEPEGWKLYITDVETERRVQISETCATDFIEFALNSNNIISTRCGNIDLNQLDLNGDQHTFKATGIIIHGYGLGDDWIQKDGKPIIWLPPEYRMYWGRYSIGNSQIAIATISGRFVLIDFAE